MIKKGECDHLLGWIEYDEPTFEVYESHPTKDKFEMDMVFVYCPFCGIKLPTHMEKGIRKYNIKYKGSI